MRENVHQANIESSSHLRLLGLNSQIRSHSTEKSQSFGSSKLSQKEDEGAKKTPLSGKLKSKKSIGFVPRTGIELPFLANRPRFIETCREFEPIHSCSPFLAEEFARQDNERLNSIGGTMH